MNSFKFISSEQVVSKNVVLQPQESFVLRSEATVYQPKHVYEYFQYRIHDL